MHRDKFTEKLVRILKAVESETFPANIREVYVFGSYSRGAIEPHDLDLIVVYGQQTPGYGKATLEHFQRRGMSLLASLGPAVTKFRADMARPLRKPGEPIQIIFVQDVNQIVHEDSRIKPGNAILLWSEHDRDWRSKLATIKGDDTAGRADRNHIVAMTRLHDYVGTMEVAVEMIELERLTITRIPRGSIVPSLNPYHTRRLDTWQVMKSFGQKSMTLLPFALWWLEEHNQRQGSHDRTVLWSDTQTHRVELGRPSLRRMLWVFEHKPKVNRQCLIPHFKARSENDLLAFERGPKWADHKKGDALYDKLYD